MTPITTPSLVAITRDSAVGTITIDHPPVNALNQPMRSALLAAVRQLIADPSITSVVIMCVGRTFIAGADITELSRAPVAPHLPQITDEIEASPKPIVVAMHGTVLGGGFEVALAAHYRICVPETQFGFPEVKLGLLPGSGGTQRLPRLVGVKRALSLITSGQLIGASDLLADGAIDEIIQTDLQGAAIAAAQRLSAHPTLLRRTGSLPVEPVEESAFDVAEALAARTRGSAAVGACIAAIRAALSGGFSEGLAQERELFLALRASPESAGLRHAFLGERAVATVPDLPAGTATRPISRVAIIGAGTMGTGIAMCFLNVGLAVTVLEADQNAMERGGSAIRKNYAASVARGNLTEEQMTTRLALLELTLSWDRLSTADLLLEAVFEDFAVKCNVLAKMDAAAKDGAILATNTSYLDVTLLAASTRRPQDVIGLHFFSPANVMRLLEVIRGTTTAPDVQATAMKLGRTLGKVAVMVRGSDGFIGNRMLAQRSREAYFLLEEGALPAQIDQALVDFGFPMGPFAAADLAGLDIGWRNRQSRAHLRVPSVRDCNLLDKVCELGRFGQKTGAGWYRYAAGDRKPIPDANIEALIVAHSHAKGIARRFISNTEIVERCVFSLINEGYKILEEGAALRAVDIDMVWIHGYGFPPWRGGPMFYAEIVGPHHVLSTIERLRERFGSTFWTPSKSLRDAARAASARHN